MLKIAVKIIFYKWVVVCRKNNRFFLLVIYLCPLLFYFFLLHSYVRKSILIHEEIERSR